MRGNYHTSREERRRFFIALCQLCDNPTVWHDLVSTQLSLRDCVELLEELSYDQDCWDTNGWEGEIWCKYTHAEAPAINLMSEAYTGELTISFSGIDDDVEINVEALKELMRKHWGKYFPVI